MKVSIVTAPIVVLGLFRSSCDAFFSPINKPLRTPAVELPSNSLFKNEQSHSNVGFRTSSPPKAKSLNAVPTLDNWSVSNTGEATGRVTNHPNPNIYDGEYLTTSPLRTQSSQLKEGIVVTTASGSKYKLGKPVRPIVTTAPPPPVANGASSPSPTPTADPPTPSPRRSGGGWGGFGGVGRKVCVINDWSFTFRGELTGIVSGHPDRNFPDGDTITTSKVMGNRNAFKEGDMVITSSESQYTLGRKRNTSGGFFSSVKAPSAKSQGGTYNTGKSQSFAIKTQDQEQKEEKRKSVGLPSTFQILNQQLSDAIQNFGGTGNDSSAPTKSSQPDTKTLSKDRMRELKRTYGINGKTIGNGKYLLIDNPKKSTSGKSNIWNAYKADADGEPVGQLLTIKVSNNFEALSREDSNYNRVCSGIFPGRFVNKAEFLGSTDGLPPKEFANSCALVIENGRKDLRAILNERGGRGFEGRAMRDAAIAALQCIQAMHSSGMVWTDLKTENFVIVSDEIGDNGYLPGVKGIDLESAIKKGSNPVDFSPEACPPEFATAFVSGQALDFRLEYSYDIWSYGMMLYELTTGRPYFENKSPAQITMSLQYAFEADLSAVTDDKLRDLINQCLQYDARKRPGVPQLLIHPYFLTSGFGW